MASLSFEMSSEFSGDGRSQDSVQNAVTSARQSSNQSRLIDFDEQLRPFMNPSPIPESIPTTIYSKCLLGSSVPVSTFSSPRDFNRNPYTETGYTPKRFRPEEYEEQFSGDDELIDPTMSSSRAWMPPEYTDELSQGQGSPILPTPLSRSTNDYTGATLYPGQLSSLTMYGLPRRSSTSHNAATSKTKLRDSTQHNEYWSLEPKLSQHHPSPKTPANEALEVACFHNSPPTSSPETLSGSSVQLADSEGTSSTFADRAKRAGIPDWNENVTKGLEGNHSVFDSRWVLNSNEAWNVPARQTSVLTISPERQTSRLDSAYSAFTEPLTNADIDTTTTDMRSSEEIPVPVVYQGSQSDLEALEDELEQMQLKQTTLHRKDPTVDKGLSDNFKKSMDDGRDSSRMDDVPEAEEPLRLEQYVTDLSIANDGLQSKLEYYDPASIRRVFYQRVFHNPDPQIPQGKEAKRLVKYNGKIVTFGDLNLYLRGEIGDLVAYMTAPVGQGTVQQFASKTGAADTRPQQTKTLFGRGMACDNVQSANDLAKQCGLQYQLGLQPPHELLHQQTQAQSGIEDHHHFNEQLHNIVQSGHDVTPMQAYPSATQTKSSYPHQENVAAQPGPANLVDLTDNVEAKFSPNYQQANFSFVNQLPKSAITHNPTGIANAQIRSQSRFGDPATAQFQPIVTAHNADFKGSQNSVRSIGDTLSLRESAGTSYHPRQSLHGHASGATQPIDSTPTANGAKLAGATLNTLSLAQQPITSQPTASAAGRALGGVASASDIPRFPTVLRDDYDSTHQSHLLSAQDWLLDGHIPNFNGSSSGPGLQRSLLDIPVQTLRPNARPEVRTYLQNQQLFQAQLQAQFSAQAQTQAQVEAEAQAQAQKRAGIRSRYQTERLTRAQVPQGQIQPLSAQGLDYRISGQQFGPQAFEYNAPMNSLAVPSQILGTPNQSISSPDKHTLNQSIAAQYQQQAHQSMPQYQNTQQATCNNMGREGMPTVMMAGQLYKQAPSIFFQPNIQYGVVPSPTIPTYVQPYIPVDKYARAPAPNRIASRFAQANAFQPTQSTGNMGDSVGHSRFPSPTPNSYSYLSTLPYRVGSDNMFPNQRPGAASVRYQYLTRDEPPKLAVAGDENYIPFIETTKLSKPAEWGVLKVSNMPYDITREYIHAFLGTHAKTITPDLGPCIHIMMDRSTGKTQDCYVEFFSIPDANAWRSVITRRSPHLNKIGDRILEVDLSSQEELMKELFPRARCVVWNGQSGLQVKETEEAFDSGFKGFVTQEEIKGLIHHAEQPHRSIYTQKCPSRPYTNMISILAKFPWHASAYYTLSTRNALFNATRTLIKTLVIFLRRSSSISSQGHRTNPSLDSDTAPTINPFSGLSMPPLNPFRPDLSASEMTRLEMREKGLNESLLKELVLAGMNAYGFSEQQRLELYLAASNILGRQWIRLSPLMPNWPFEVVGRKGGFEEDVVEFYAHLLSSHPPLSPFDPAIYPPLARPREWLHPDLPFGRFNKQLYENSVEGYKAESVSMEDLGAWEIGVIKGVIKSRCRRDDKGT